MAAARGAAVCWELLVAVFEGEKERLSERLARASPAELAGTYPLSLYHAAALWGDAETVHLLTAACRRLAVTPAAAANGTAAADLLHLEGEVAQELSHFQCTALGAAAWRGADAVMDALLAAGAAVDQPSPQMPGVLTRRVSVWRTQPHPPVALDVVACCSAEFGEQHTEALLRQLLAAGADVTLMNLQSLPSCGRGPALLLLQHFQLASEQGRLPMSAEDEDSWLPLLRLATAGDSVPALEHFWGRVQQLPLAADWLTSAVPNCLLRTAAGHSSLSVLRLAAQAADQLAAGGAAEARSVVAGALGPRLVPSLPILLEQAAERDQPAAVQLLLELGAVPSARVFVEAVSTGALRALRALLSHGLPSFSQSVPQPLQLPTRPFSIPYICPILATLQTRLIKARLPFQANRPFQSSANAVHPLDATLLPGLEVLLSAGYRPRTFCQVLVSMHGGAPQLRERFDPLDPIAGDPGLEVTSDNRWLALAIQHPDWSPAMHRRFFASFRAAIRTLLLVAWRGGPEPVAGSWAAGLASLPLDLLHRIIGLAAYPLSAWAPLDAAALKAAGGDGCQRVGKRRLRRMKDSPGQPELKQNV